MRFGSLFTGIGGLDLGLERAGMECAWQVEIDPYCRAVLEKHWPGVPRWDDVKTFTGEGFEPVDLICGGFPCQPHSSASHGRRLGTADSRWLWPDMRRIVRFAKPTWVVAENVPHLDGPALKQVVSDLEEDLYEVGILEVPACAFGFTHRRNRYWICGYSDSNSEPRFPINAEMAGLSRPRHRNTGEVGATYGVSSRMDRLAALGNAVVPQVAEAIGRAIMTADSLVPVEEP